MNTIEKAVLIHNSWKREEGISDIEFNLRKELYDKETYYFTEFLRFVCFQFSMNKECPNAQLYELVGMYPLLPMEFYPGMSDDESDDENVGLIVSSFGNMGFSLSYNLRTTAMTFLVSNYEYRFGRIQKIREKVVLNNITQSNFKQSLQTLFSLWNTVGKWDVVYERPA